MRKFESEGVEDTLRKRNPVIGKIKEINVTPRVSILTIYVCDQPSQSSGGFRRKRNTGPSDGARCSHKFSRYTAAGSGAPANPMRPGGGVNPTRG